MVVGVNAFTEGEALRPAPQRIDPETERRQVERTRAVRAGRDGRLADEALERLGEAARGTENLLPRIRACVEARLTTAGFFGSGFATGAGFTSGVTCGCGAGAGAGAGAGLGASCVAQPAARSAARINKRFFIGVPLGDFWWRI